MAEIQQQATRFLTSRAEFAHFRINESVAEGEYPAGHWTFDLLTLENGLG